MKEELLRKLEVLSPHLPPNTLDELIDDLGGPSRVGRVPFSLVSLTPPTLCALFTALSLLLSPLSSPCVFSLRLLPAPGGRDDGQAGSRGESARRLGPLPTAQRVGRLAGDAQSHRETEVHGRGEEHCPHL